MTAIGNLSSVGAAHAPPAHQNAPQSKTQQSQSGPDTVHLSKAALAALSGGDADHDGDSH
jgi:hypothetical protein